MRYQYKRRFPRYNEMTDDQKQAMADYLDMAIKEIGTAAELCRMLNIKSSAMAQWDRVPSEHVREIEYRTDGKVTRYQLRPDLYGDGTD